MQKDCSTCYFEPFNHPICTNCYKNKINKKNKDKTTSIYYDNYIHKDAIDVIGRLI